LLNLYKKIINKKLKNIYVNEKKKQKFKLKTQTNRKTSKIKNKGELNYIFLFVKNLYQSKYLNY